MQCSYRYIYMHTSFLKVGKATIFFSLCPHCHTHVYRQRTERVNQHRRICGLQEQPQQKQQQRRQQRQQWRQRRRPQDFALLHWVSFEAKLDALRVFASWVFCAYSICLWHHHHHCCVLFCHHRNTHIHTHIQTDRHTNKHTQIDTQNNRYTQTHIHPFVEGFQLSRLCAQSLDSAEKKLSFLIFFFFLFWLLPFAVGWSVRGLAFYFGYLVYMHLCIHTCIFKYTSIYIIVLQIRLLTMTDAERKSFFVHSCKFFTFFFFIALKKKKIRFRLSFFDLIFLIFVYTHLYSLLFSEVYS